MTNKIDNLDNCNKKNIMKMRVNNNNNNNNFWFKRADNLNNKEVMKKRCGKSSKMGSLRFVNMLTIMFIMLMMLLILISDVSAIGITPGRKTVNYIPSLNSEVEFSVLNTENKDMNIAFNVKGDLAEYINITEDVISFSSSESGKDFIYNIQLPEELEPGLHTADVAAVELPPDIDDLGMIVKATVSVVTQLQIYVPYPGK